MTGTLMSLVILVSATVTLDCIYNYLSLQSILYFLQPQQYQNRLWYFSWRSDPYLIPEGSGSFLILPGLVVVIYH